MQRRRRVTAVWNRTRVKVEDSRKAEHELTSPPRLGVARGTWGMWNVPRALGKTARALMQGIKVSNVDLDRKKRSRDAHLRSKCTRKGRFVKLKLWLMQVDVELRGRLAKGNN